MRRFFWHSFLAVYVTPSELTAANSSPHGLTAMKSSSTKAGTRYIQKAREYIQAVHKNTHTTPRQTFV